MNMTALARRRPLACAICALSLAGCSSRMPEARSAMTEGASSCTGVCLAGLDPYDAGCASDAATTASAPAFDTSGHAVAVVELRRSERCGASWARAVRLSGASGALVASVSAVGHSNSFEHATDGEVWTDMVPTARACATATGGIRRHDGVALYAQATTCAGLGVVGMASE